MGFRGRPGGGMNMTNIAPFTKVVKILVIVNVAIWLIGQVIIEGFILKGTGYVTLTLGLTPMRVLDHYQIWQLFTYMFVHSLDPMHILFNMLLLWWLGGELETLWGSKFFTLYYFI